METRPDPDEILARVKAEDTRRGKLKVFFGAVAGVGKTYSMLETARLRKKEGLDVVVGYVETHGRVETEALLAGLEILPPKAVRYKNVDLREFDIDAALERNPRLILVDELAHTNAAGSRHPKRWQDVEELLDKGIDVYTTLNVQHWESATDIVAQVTGVTVRETVPDTFLEKAAEIELVDLPAEELLKRLKEGKVYLGEQAERAAQHFFQPGNLIALRQLALRYTGYNVDAKLQSYMRLHSISKAWKVRDHFLVCISSSPNSARLIRAGKRIASDLGSIWTVAHVAPPAELRQEDKDRVAEMMRFAEKLGAQTVTLSGQEVAETLISYARAKNITRMIVGKPRKGNWREFIFGSVIAELARKCGEIDLYLISGDPQEQTDKFKPVVLSRFSWDNLLWTMGVVILCTLVDRLLFSRFALVNLIMVYLLGVTWVAFKYGRRLSFIASFLSVLSFDFFFVPPRLSFAVLDIQYVFTLLVMLVVTFTIASLTGRLRRQNITMQTREDRTNALYALNRDLSKSSYPEELLKISLAHVQEFFKCGVVVFIPDAGKKLAVRSGKNDALSLTANELAVAQWVYEHGKTAGKDTDTLPGSDGIYLPFVGSEKTIGVIGVFPREGTRFVDPDQFHLLEMFVGQTALAVEGAQLAATAIDAESKIENERFRNLLLTTFSADLTGPLTALSQSVSELLKPENMGDDVKRAGLMEKTRREAERLNALVAELPKILEPENPTRHKG